MKLHEVPHEKIRVGDRVVSSRGRPGVITHAVQERLFAISIQWSREAPWNKETQDESHFYLYYTTNAPDKPIEYLGQ